MDDVGRYLWGLVIFIILTLFAMLFSSCEVSISLLSAGKLKKQSEDGDKKAIALSAYKSRQADFFLYLNLSAVLCVSSACLLSTYFLYPLMQSIFAAIFGASATINLISVIIAFCVMAFIALVLGIALPKKLATDKPEETAFMYVWVLKTIAFIFKPLVFLPIKLSRGLSYILGIDPNKKIVNITEEDIRMLIDAGNENGAIELSESEMINNIFEFDDKTVVEVMTHRTDIIAVEKNDEISKVVNAAIQEGFSRIPVYNGDIDNIEGIIYVKDLLYLVGQCDILDVKITDFMREVMYAPESAKCRELFRDLKERKTHMAVIVDEYGGTSGIVTMEDLLETIVGNIQDEYDEEEEEIKKLDENNYSLDGGLYIEDVEKLFGVTLSDDDDSETLGGLIVNTLGKIPLPNEETTININDVEFTVLQVEERRIKRVKAVRMPVNEKIEGE